MKSPTVGKYYMSESPTTKLDASIRSGVKCIGMDDKGKHVFKRLHHSHNGEVFSMRPDEFEKSLWIEVPINSQLELGM